MRRIIAVFLIISMLILSGCSLQNKKVVEEKAKISAVWIYFSELSMKEKNGGTEKSFTEKIDKIYSDCIKLGINTVFVQVRPCCDAFYKSDIFPWSYYLTGEQGGKIEYDPLKIMVDEGHKNNLSVHAWINPFRISFNTDKEYLSKDNPALKFMNSKDKNEKNAVIEANNGLYFSPASLQAQRLVLDGVREIVENYDVDGIHIDDYFYPSTQKKVDSFYYEKYTKSGGKLDLDDWRLNTISSFISQMYTTVKSIDSQCIFSISPAGNIENNYNQQFADVKLWTSQRGYADWIIPQIYYGFENEKLTFSIACDQWSKLNKIGAVKMIWGIAAYKINDSDDEWKAGNGIIKKQLEYAKKSGSYYGAAFFSYSSLVDKSRIKEYENLEANVLS